MLNVIKRELNLQLSSLKGMQMVIIAIVMIFIGTTNPTQFTSMLIMMCVISSLGYTAIECRNGVNKYLLSCPCTRKQYVMGKFISTIIILSTTTVIAGFLNRILVKIIPDMFLVTSFHELKVLFLYGLIITSIYYLAYFSLGIKAATISYYISFVIAMIGFMSINSIFSYMQARKVINLLTSNNIILNLMLIIIGLAISAIVCVLSIVFYEKKDF